MNSDGFMLFYKAEFPLKIVLLVFMVIAMPANAGWIFTDTKSTKAEWKAYDSTTPCAEIAPSIPFLKIAPTLKADHSMPEKNPEWTQKCSIIINKKLIACGNMSGTTQNTFWFETQSECTKAYNATMKIAASLASKKQPFYFYIVDYTRNRSLSQPSKIITNNCQVVTLSRNDVFEHFNSLGSSQGYKYVAPGEKPRKNACLQNAENDGSIYCRKNANDTRYYKYFDSTEACSADYESMMNYLSSAERSKAAADAQRKKQIEESALPGKLLPFEEEIDKDQPGQPTPSTWKRLEMRIAALAQHMRQGHSVKENKQMKGVVARAFVLEKRARENEKGLGLRKLDKYLKVLRVIDVDLDIAILVGEGEFDKAEKVVTEYKEILNESNPQVASQLLQQIKQARSARKGG